MVMLSSRQDYLKQASMLTTGIQQFNKEEQVQLEGQELPAMQLLQYKASNEEQCPLGAWTPGTASPSDVGHLLLLADIDLEVSVPLVDAHHLVLIYLVTSFTKQLASLLDAFQSV